MLAVGKTLGFGRYFCQKAAPQPNAWPPGRRTRDLDANRGYRRTAGSLDAAEALEPTTSATALAKEAEAVARCQELIGEAG